MERAAKKKDMSSGKPYGNIGPKKKGKRISESRKKVVAGLSRGPVPGMGGTVGGRQKKLAANILRQTRF